MFSYENLGNRYLSLCPLFHVAENAKLCKCTESKVIASKEVFHKVANLFSCFNGNNNYNSQSHQDYI